MSDPAVIDAVLPAVRYGWQREAAPTFAAALQACQALGIDPEMPLSVLRSRLRIGERAERCEVRSMDQWDDAVHTPGGIFLGEEAVWLLVWLRAVDTKETPQ
jgi:hypothetical protein